MNEGAHADQLVAMLSRLDAEAVIVADGGSTDGSAETLRQAGLHVISAPKGRAVQMNAGAAEADSEILLFLHADTEISRHHLDRIREIMADPAVAGGRFDVRLSGDSTAFRVIEYFMNLRSRLSRISTGDQGIFVRRSIFGSLGGFPDQPLMEDIAFSRNLRQAGRIACLRDKVTSSGRRWEKHGIAATVLLMWKLRLLYWLGADPTRLKSMYEDH